MLRRALTLFAPTSSPLKDDKSWVAAHEAHVEWAKKKVHLLTTWAENRARYLEESEDRYFEKRECLVEALAQGGEKAHTLSRKLEHSLGWTDEAGKEAGKQGFHLGVDTPQCYTHVSSAVMEHLDRVYIAFFRKGGAGSIKLVDCFALHLNEPKREKFKEYLSAVCTAMADLLAEGSDLGEAYKKGSPQAYGVSEAVCRLDPLFYPIDGRISLPLPTVSMLEDLKQCVLRMDSKLMCQVCVYTGPGAQHRQPTIPQIGRWFDGLGSHMIYTVKGHGSGVYNWSDVIHYKVRNLARTATPSAQDRLVLSVSISLHLSVSRTLDKRTLAGLQRHHVQGS